MNDEAKPAQKFFIKLDLGVTLAEMRTWSADRIALYFSGIAKILYAVRGVKC